MNNTVWLVLGDNGGAWEPLPVLSIWTTEEAAQQEAQRVKAHEEAGSYAGRTYLTRVVAVPVNRHSFEPIN